MNKKSLLLLWPFGYVFVTRKQIQRRFLAHSFFEHVVERKLAFTISTLDSHSEVMFSAYAPSMKESHFVTINQAKQALNLIEQNAAQQRDFGRV